MEHDLELCIPRLEILEIEVSNILQNPGNIGKLIFSIQSSAALCTSLCKLAMQ